MRLRRLAAIAAAMSLAPVALFLAATGCSENRQADPAAKQQAATAARPVDTPFELHNLSLQRDTWDIILMQGKRVGYVHTTLSSAVQSGKKVMVIDQLTHLAVKRFGQSTEQEIRLQSVETPDGGLLEFSCDEMHQGTTPLKTKGWVAGKQLNITTISKGNTSTDSISWSPEFKGFLGGEQSLLDNPMQPGQQRTIHMLMAILNQVATIEMVAGDREPVQLLTGTYELLKIEATITLPGGQSLHQTIWCDRAGNGLKTLMKEMGLETFRATKAQALEKTEAADLGWGIAVKVEGTLSRPHQSKQIRYRVHLDGSDPTTVFVSGASQRVESINAETADLTVYALRPDSRNANPAAADKPTADDRQPNNYIQSDHAKVVALARKACGDETDPWKTAVKLERFVNDYVSKKDFSQAFATAAEVAENPVGDCSEHAVLLAALARARGIPARVAMGLVFVPDAAASPEKQAGGKFLYHMWTEVYVDGLWIPIDATLAMGGIGAGHLKLAHSNLKGASAISSFISVAQVLGRLKIESRQDPGQR
ncbi:MAG: transglutaminase-like domain-containing protein [Thermoguttaceae bacterium]